ncbi:hypothetical protein APR11_004758 [Nocardia amikacinitolerans]|nr:hypothetical protein [Nocardia amikacinitolerans]
MFVQGLSGFLPRVRSVFDQIILRRMASVLLRPVSQRPHIRGLELLPSKRRLEELWAYGHVVLAWLLYNQRRERSAAEPPGRLFVARRRPTRGPNFRGFTKAIYKPAGTLRN